MKLNLITKVAAKITDAQYYDKIIQKNSKKLNILMVCPYFFPDPGGMQNYAYNISKKLVQKGHIVTVLCSTKDSVDSIEQINGIKVIRHRPDIIVSNTPIRFDLFAKMSKLINNEKYDLINAVTPVPFYSEIASLVCKIHKIPFILTYHNDVIKPTFPMNLISTIYNKTLGVVSLRISSFIITSSPYCYHESQFLSSFKDKLVLIPPAVDLENYHIGKSFILHDSYKLPYNSKIILFVGQLSKTHTHKGVDDLIKAFHIVLDKNKSSYLIIVGKGNMIPLYQKLCRDLSIFDKVMFPGFVKENELIEYYKGANIVVLPSTRVAEGFGMVLIEGNACGKPVIGTKVGGIKYVIKDNVTGLLVPPRDPTKLAGAITKLLNNACLSSSMGANGRKLVEEEYNWEKASDSTYNLFIKCVE